MKIGPSRTPKNLFPLQGNRVHIPSGSMIVSDVFNPSEPSDVSFHGGSVVAGSRSLGFEAPIFYQQVASTPNSAHRDGLQALQSLSSHSLSPEAVLTAVESFSRGAPNHMLHSATQEIEAATESGAEQTVLNLSSGTSKAQITQILYQQASQAWQNGDPSAHLALENFAGAWNINSDELLHSDPQVFGPARRRLQQNIVSEVHKAWESDLELSKEKARFEVAIEKFEAKQNSVVIAAGNEGFVKPILEMGGQGDLHLPEDFEKNILFSEQATMVGASLVLDGEEVEATYTSGDQAIQAYASGDHVIGREFDDKLGLRGAGTSIATPRIGAVMAKLHAENPSSTSEQVESLLQEQFLFAQDRMLDHHKAYAFLNQKP